MFEVGSSRRLSAHFDIFLIRYYTKWWNMSSGGYGSQATRLVLHQHSLSIEIPITLRKSFDTTIHWNIWERSRFLRTTKSNLRSRLSRYSSKPNIIIFHLSNRKLSSNNRALLFTSATL